MRSIGMVALALGLSVEAGLPAEIGGPGQFPGCPDPASVALAYRDEGSGVASLLRPESLLYGKVELWPVAVGRGDCPQPLVVARATLSVNYTPVPAEQSNLFRLDIGTGLHGNLVELSLTLSDPRGATTTITRRVWTLDASTRTSGKRSVGSRIEETQKVRGGPPDRLTLTLVARDASGGYVTDLRRDELAVRLESRRIPDEDILELRPPAPEAPIRLIVLVDVSPFLEQGESRARFNARYPDFVEQVILEGLATLVRHIQESTGPVPAVEVGLVRYALSAQWLKETFWRADKGFPAATAASMRDFLLTPPPASWPATGATDADAALDSLRRLWHYFDGRRALLIIPGGREAYTGRGLHSYLPPGPDETRIGAEPIEAVAEKLRGGDTTAVRYVLQHTERRYPGVYALVPNVPVADQGRGIGWFRLLADATGGVWETENIDGLSQQFASLLRLVFDDLRNSHTLSVDVPNEDQVPGWKRIFLTSMRHGVTLQAPTMYEASGSICHYLGSYLVTEDPITRLVAASEAGACWERPGLQELLLHRLYGDSSSEENPLVREELYRSLLEVTFRLLQNPSGKIRRSADRNLRTVLARADQDDALRASYRAIAGRLHEP